jgi:hypothetical protein
LALTEGRKRTYAFGKLDSGAKQVLKGIDVRAPSIRPIKATRSLARTAGDALDSNADAATSASYGRRASRLAVLAAI